MVTRYLFYSGRTSFLPTSYKCLTESCIFTVYRPGIKTKETLQSAVNMKKVAAQNDLIKKTIFPQIRTLYGERKGCELL